MEDASLEHPWNWHLGLCCNFTMVLMELGPTMVPGPMVLPILGRGLWGRDCCPCVCMCGAYKGALISVGASGPCHNAEIMSLLLSAHSTSSLRWLASSSRQNLPRLKWMCHHLPQQIRSPLMMGQTPLARRATAVIQAPFIFFFFPLFPLFPVHMQVVSSPQTPGQTCVGGHGQSKLPISPPDRTGVGVSSHGGPVSPASVLGSSRRPARRKDGFPAWAAIGSTPALPLGRTAPPLACLAWQLGRARVGPCVALQPCEGHSGMWGSPGEPGFPGGC